MYVIVTNYVNWHRKICSQTGKTQGILKCNLSGYLLLVLPIGGGVHGVGEQLTLRWGEGTSCSGEGRPRSQVTTNSTTDTLSGAPLQRENKGNCKMILC